MTAFIATLGQRPEAITMALGALLQHDKYNEGVFYTDAERSGIVDAYTALMLVFKIEYDGLKLRGERIVPAQCRILLSRLAGKSTPVSGAVHPRSSTYCWWTQVHEHL